MNNNLPSQRQVRYAELIRSLISDCFLKEDFYGEFDIYNSVTISYVKMSKDLKIANVYLMPLGGLNKQKILLLLNEKKYRFQKYLSEAKLRSKFTPKIKFFIDDTFDEAEKIEKLLLTNNVKRDLK